MEGCVTQCAIEPKIIAVTASKETLKGEAGVSKFIRIRQIYPFFDEPFSALSIRHGVRRSLKHTRALTVCCRSPWPSN